MPRFTLYRFVLQSMLLSTAFSGLEKKLKKSAKTKNPNLSTLSSAILEKLEGQWDTSRVMVFVQTRATCQALCSWLNSDDVTSELQQLKASPFTGTGAHQDEGGEKYHVQHFNCQLILTLAIMVCSV